MDSSEFTARFDYDPDEDLLGEGGFGKIFRAWDNVRNEYIALKMSKVQPDLEAFSLLNEYERVKSLEHPNIARYMDCRRIKLPGMGTHDVALMKHYEHGNLSQLLAKQTLTQRQKERVIEGILDGISYLHQRRPLIIHSDLKPSNILIVERRGFYIPLITDFGISRQARQDDKSYVTNTVGAGTYAYAAPEQWEAKELRPNADLWSFGILAIYVWFNGKKLPFRSDDLSMASESGRIEYMRRVMALDFIPDLKGLPETYRKMVLACLVTDPAKRVKSTVELQSLVMPPAAKEEHTLISPPRQPALPSQRNHIEEKTQLYSPQADNEPAPVVSPPEEKKVTEPVGEPPVKKRQWMIPAGATTLALAAGLGWYAYNSGSQPNPDHLPDPVLPLDTVTREARPPAADSVAAVEQAQEPIVKSSSPPPPTVTREPEDNAVYHVADVPAAFPGGDGEMQRWIARNRQMPERAAAVPYFSGTVRLSFVVNKDGRAEDIQLLKGAGYGCDEEAARLVNSMPRWTPALNNGKKVRFKQTLTIVFE